MNMSLTHNAVPLPAAPPPGRGIDILVIDVSDYHGGVRIDCHSLKYDAIMPVVNVPM